MSHAAIRQPVLSSSKQPKYALPAWVSCLSVALFFMFEFMQDLVNSDSCFEIDVIKAITSCEFNRTQLRLRRPCLREGCFKST